MQVDAKKAGRLTFKSEEKASKQQELSSHDLLMKSVDLRRSQLPSISLPPSTSKRTSASSQACASSRRQATI